MDFMLMYGSPVGVGGEMDSQQTALQGRYVDNHVLRGRVLVCRSISRVQQTL